MVAHGGHVIVAFEKKMESESGREDDERKDRNEEKIEFYLFHYNLQKNKASMY